MSRSLTARLRGHVAGDLDVAELAWWGAQRSARPLAGRRSWWRPEARRRRDAELAEIVGHLSVLIALERSVPAALRRVVEHGNGAVVAELSVVEGWMRDGLPARMALRRWVAVTACDGVGRLAAALTGPHEDVAVRLDDLAAALHQRAHDHRMAVLEVVSSAVWFLSLLAAVVALITVA